MSGSFTTAKGKPMAVKKIPVSKIEGIFYDKWRRASWTSSDDARQLEYQKLNTAERLQYFLLHGSSEPKLNSQQEEK